jgi:hypothetical protein
VTHPERDLGAFCRQLKTTQPVGRDAADHPHGTRFTFARCASVFF